MASMAVPMVSPAHVVPGGQMSPLQSPWSTPVGTPVAGGYPPRASVGPTLPRHGFLSVPTTAPQAQVVHRASSATTLPRASITSPAGSPFGTPGTGYPSVPTPTMTPRACGMIPIPNTLQAQAPAQVKPAASISSLRYQAASGASTAYTTPVSQSSETSTWSQPVQQIPIPPLRAKVGAPFDVPRASVREKCPSWASPSPQRVKRRSKPPEKASKEETAAGKAPVKSEAVDTNQMKKERPSLPSPKGRARSARPRSSSAGSSPRHERSRRRRSLSSNKPNGWATMSASSLLSSAGCQTPLTRVLEEKDEGDAPPGDPARERASVGLSSALNRMEDSIQTLLRRRSGAAPVVPKLDLRGEEATVAAPVPMTRCSDVAQKSEGYAERTLAGQLKQKLEHVRQMSSQESQFSDESRESSRSGIRSDLPSRWHSARLVEKRRGE
ncbi:Putative glycosyltransferase [Durusdinium trenchii]|uniref:Glycosyltransferase n=1 Tax=Durusdinium trenchii TaxID=1381693 RepID=A0ABP0JLM7_9DINO